MKRTIFLKMLLTASSLLAVAAAGYAQQLRYPYVTTNGQSKKTVVVCREGKDGVKGSLIHEKWLVTPAHNELDAANNRFSARFEVASADASAEKVAWTAAAQACSSYTQASGGAGTWRLPTVRELRLIYALRNELSDAKLSANAYWSATEHSDSGLKPWLVDFKTGYTNNAAYDSYFVRCVRDLQ